MTEPPNTPEQHEKPETTDEFPPLPADRDWPRAWMSPFLRALSVLPDVSSACRIARVGRTTVYDARNGAGDRPPVPGFADAWDEADALARDYLHRHAHTWITTGVPVRSQRTVTKTTVDAEGKTTETVTTVTATESAERSATLMIFWLKAFYPDRFRWVERIGGEGDGGAIRLESVESVDAQIAKLSAELAERGGADPVPVE